MGMPYFGFIAFFIFKLFNNPPEGVVLVRLCVKKTLTCRNVQPFKESWIELRLNGSDCQIFLVRRFESVVEMSAGVKEVFAAGFSPHEHVLQENEIGVYYTFIKQI